MGATTVTTAYCYVGKFLGSLSDVWAPSRTQNTSVATPAAQRPNTSLMVLVVVIVSTVAIAIFAARCLFLLSSPKLFHSICHSSHLNFCFFPIRYKTCACNCAATSATNYARARRLISNLPPTPPQHNIVAQRIARL